MNNNWLIRNTWWMALLVLAQVAILNGIDYWQAATPFLYILCIIDMPTDVNRNVQLIVAFLIGLVVDIFSTSIGIHAFACVLIAALKNPAATLFDQNDGQAVTPSMSNMGTARYLQYALLLTLVHHFAFYLLENGSFANIGMATARALQSSLLTMVLIFCIEYFKQRHQRQKK